MIRLAQAVVVEGAYDKIRLSTVVDALIIPVDGFHIFKDPQTVALLRKLAVTRGIIILTDSDAAGFMIRHHLQKVVTEGQVLNAYIPDLPGKEKRKKTPSAEGKLGVEGMPTAVLTNALAAAGVTWTDASPAGRPITHADLYRWGLSGQPQAALRRAALLRVLDLPARMNTRTMLEVFNRLYSYEQIERTVADSAT